MRSNRCANCDFYRKMNSEIGECMAQPPQLQDNDNPEVVANWFRPLVYGDDYCATHKPKPKAGKASSK